MDTAGEHFKQGKDYYKNNEFEDATKEFEHAIRIDRGNEEYYYWCGLSYYENEDYDEAIEKFENAIELNSTKGDYFYYCGLAYYKKGEYDKAIENFEQSMEINDNDDECFYWCGLSYYENEEYDKAIENFKKAINLNNTNEDFFYWAGRCYYNTKNYGNAIEEFEQSINISSNNDECFYWCGLAYYKKEDYDTAIEKFEKAIELNDENPDYFYFCGLSYYNLEEYDEAERNLLLGVKLKPYDIYFYYRDLGNLKMDTNDYNSAREYYELALENAENDDQKNSINDKISDLDNIEEDKDDNEITDNDEEYYEDEDSQEKSAEEDGDSYREIKNRDNDLNINSISKFGIDFGTTNSALVSITGSGSNIKSLYYGDDNGYPFPSLVAIKKDGTEIKTGREVKDNLAKYLSDDYYYFESIKSIIDKDKEWKVADKIYTPVDVVAELFKALYKKVEDRGDRIDKAIVAVPVGFTSREKECLRDAALKAGFKINMFVSEPTAAFCCNYNDLKVKNNIVIFDWGGGTLDIAVLNVRNGRVSEVATGGMKLAGGDIDKKFAEHVHKYFCENNPEKNRLFDEVPDDMRFLLLSKCEQAKCCFSKQDDVSIKLNNYLSSQLRFDISYERFKYLIENEVNKAVDCLEETIKKANLNIETLDCILCVGGSSNLRPLKEKLEEKYYNKVRIPKSTGWNIAKGAAIIAGKPGKHALSKSIGLLLCDDTFLPLLQVGQELPCKDGIVTLSITEGNPNNDNSANFIFIDSDKRPLGDPLIVPVRGFDDEKITLSYSVDPNYTFRAEIKSSKKIAETLFLYDKLNVYYQIEDLNKDE